MLILTKFGINLARLGYAPRLPDPNVLNLLLLHKCFGEKQGLLYLVH